MFPCTICSRSFSQKGNLKSHMKLHTDDHPVYECPECDRSFNHKSNYTKHMLNHKNPNFRCSKKRRNSRQVLIHLKAEDDLELTEDEEIDEVAQVSEEFPEDSTIEVPTSGKETESTVYVCNPKSSVMKPVIIIKHKIIPTHEEILVKREDAEDANHRDESTQEEAKEHIAEPEAADDDTVSEEAHSRSTVAEHVDLSNEELISDGVTEIIKNLVTTDAEVVQGKDDVAVAETDVEGPEPAGTQTVKVFIAEDDTAHEVETEILKDFLEKCGKNVGDDSMIPVIDEVNNQLEAVVEETSEVL